jgi:hypothetical protein
MQTHDTDLTASRAGKTNQPARLAAKAALAALVLAGLGLANWAWAGSAPLPGHARAFGKTLAQWQDTYFRWWIGQVTIPPDANGNAAVGNVVLMPLPNASGDGTPAHLDVTLNSGQAFTLPLFFLLGTSYTDGTPPDPMVDASFFQTLNLTLEIDGATVVNGSNVMDYYSQFSFAPPIPLNFPPIDSVIWCQDVAIVHTPLSVGTHTLKLDLKSTQPLPPGFGGGFPEYHNTWAITVVP